MALCGQYERDFSEFGRRTLRQSSDKKLKNGSQQSNARKKKGSKRGGKN
jgi:hypothetical protein